MFSYNASTEEPFYERQIWERVFLKSSEFKKFSKILYCGMTRFRNVKLGVFRQNQNIKTISKKKIMGQNRLKQLSKFQKFQLSNFTLTWSNHSNKKQKDSLETLAVLIEISMLC